MSKKTRVMVFMATHKPRVRNTVFSWVEDHLRFLFQDNDIDLSVTVVSSLDNIPELPHSWHHFIESNKYLGHKLNEGLRKALRIKWDYLLLMGDDNIIDDDGVFKLIDSLKASVQWAGFHSLNIVNAYTGKYKQVFTKHVFGAGLIIQRILLDKSIRKLNQCWEPPRCSAMDSSLQYHLRQANDHLKAPLLLSGRHVYDIKTDDNINAYHRFNGLEIELNSLSENSIYPYLKASQIDNNLSDRVFSYI